MSVKPGAQSMARVALVSLTPGRLLRFSPAWPCSDVAIVYDRNSGDYWVVSLLARAVLNVLQGSGSLTLGRLEQQLGDWLHEGETRFDLLPTLLSLADNGLLQLPLHGSGVDLNPV